MAFQIILVAVLIAAIAVSGWATYYGTKKWQLKEGKALAWLAGIVTLILLLALFIGMVLSYPADIYIHDTYFIRLLP